MGRSKPAQREWAAASILEGRVTECSGLEFKIQWEPSRRDALCPTELEQYSTQVRYHSDPDFIHWEPTWEPLENLGPCLEMVNQFLARG
ncbi:uncharacterized protein K489DRAFT_385584 [Dissoconium aciculare CBS 342.82]|jgi:hypothetical protein|uniref:Chromo domain-containing protein n=1 Tax=Dissoconium aciculare CBS 342.82 TaxID=1314786 RepID=A0A6J3LP35_9PEZI|nr:uncharacterized protein K489DRAFT_385584 [Dissoconium aciculare CBS 342.82]KAF1817726.1 hypothetical protein K489DRAFT_385584 [Dissoconium aciculare CBS 342.82]